MKTTQCICCMFHTPINTLESPNIDYFLTFKNAFFENSNFLVKKSLPPFFSKNIFAALNQKESRTRMAGCRCRMRMPGRSKTRLIINPVNHREKTTNMRRASRIFHNPMNSLKFRILTIKSLILSSTPGSEPTNNSSPGPGSLFSLRFKMAQPLASKVQNMMKSPTIFSYLSFIFCFFLMRFYCCNYHKLVIFLPGNHLEQILKGKCEIFGKIPLFEKNSKWIPG